MKLPCLYSMAMAVMVCGAGCLADGSPDYDAIRAVGYDIMLVAREYYTTKAEVDAAVEAYEAQHEAASAEDRRRLREVALEAFAYRQSYHAAGRDETMLWVEAAQYAQENYRERYGEEFGALMARVTAKPPDASGPSSTEILVDILSRRLEPDPPPG